MKTPKAESSNEYALMCVQFLEGKIELLRLRSKQRVLFITDEQAEHIMKQAKNLMGVKNGK